MSTIKEDRRVETNHAAMTGHSNTTDPQGKADAEVVDDYFTSTRDSETVLGGMTVLDDPVTAQYTHTLTVTGRLGGQYQCSHSRLFKHAYLHVVTAGVQSYNGANRTYKIMCFLPLWSLYHHLHWNYMTQEFACLE